MDVAAWLRGLGLEQYEAAFRANEIDASVLPRLTAEDLKDLGVTLVGHRRRLLDAIVALGPEPAAVVDVPIRAAPERRQLTVVFCDLVESTPLSGRLDPEDMRGIIGGYHRGVAETVEGFGGFVARYMGDGALIYFGYPQAHEDDAERATRCGLALVDRVGRLNLGEKLHVRVGIATGLVVVGGEVVEHDVFGETPNLAARLQTLAEPDTVIIAASTRRLVGDLFEYRDIGVVEVKGIAGRIPIWQVQRPSAVASRFEALRGAALSPLVGRDEEIELLLRRWARAKAGDGQVVLISGEPGIGKSRLTAALVERLRDEPHIRLRYFCSPYHRDSALYPSIDQLRRAAGFESDDPPALKLRKLDALLARVAPPEEDVALLADLLSLPASERHPLPNLSPQRKKERTLEALIRQLEGLARQQPIVMVFEDAHWIDPTSREFLDLRVERVRSLPVLLIVTFRPEFQPPWTGQPHVTLMALNRLDRRDRMALAVRIAGGKALPDAVVAQIVDHTDGVPLFVEELTKSILESGLLHEETERYVLDRALPALAIPTSLHDSLMARLDRLSSVRQVAQIGAVIGREFPYSLLRSVSRLPEDQLQAALARLVASELVFQRGTPPDAVYSFKHTLVQDAAHGSLLRSTRQQLHAQTAEALEIHFPEIMDTQPELLAQHYTEAGLVEKSVATWGKAGHRSAARSAMAEAAAQFQKGLEQLALLPGNRNRQQRELEYCNALGAALRAVKGQAAPETGRAYAHARELWEHLGSPSAFLGVPYGQSLYYMVRGELDLALRLDEDLLHLSRQRNDSVGLVLGHSASGRDLLLLGRFALSRSHLEEVLALYDPISHRSLVHQGGPQGASQAYLGIVLFCLGFPDRALAHSKGAISEARKTAHPPSLAVNLAVSIRLLSLVGDNAVLGDWVEELVALSTEQGFAYWGAQGTIYRGLFKVKNGDVTEGISLLRSGSAAYRATGAGVWIPHYIALLASACEIAGQIDEAATLLDDALQIVGRTGERWLAAELNRHKGLLLLRQGHAEAAEELYRKALGIAKAQEAKLWELRASVALAQLRRDQGRRAEALDLLAPVYEWFSEGFDTPQRSKDLARRAVISGLTSVARMSGIGASRPLRRIPTIVSFLNPQPAFILVCENRSSRSNCDIGRVVSWRPLSDPTADLWTLSSLAKRIGPSLTLNGLRSIISAPAIAGRQRRQSMRSFRTLTMGPTGRRGAQHRRATCLPSPLAADDTLGKAGGMIKAHAVPVPSDSVLAPLYVGADLLDAFAIHLPAGTNDDLEVLARAGLERPAGWIRALTRVRDAVMATVGVKSSRAIGAAAAARGPVIGYFPLLSKGAGELVVGEDDRHLDFRVAILLRTGAAGGRELVVVTVVHCHNRLGRTYLAVIAPFHRAIARASLEQAARVMEG